MGSELWFREFERILTEKEAAIDEGTMNPRVRAALKAKAYDEAGEEAGSALAERLADAADYERKRRKEEGR